MDSFEEGFSQENPSDGIYTKKSNNSTKVTDLLNKFNPDSFQKHLETAQKALKIVQLNLLQELAF